MTREEIASLYAFCRARCDEARAIAKAANDGPWSTPGPDTVGQWQIYDGEWEIAHASAYDHNRPLSNKPDARGPGYIDPDANAAHIAHFNPERARAELEVRGLLIETSYTLLSTVDNADRLPPGWAASPREADNALKHLRMVAAIDARHPDYRADWETP